MTREEHISNLETIGCDGWDKYIKEIDHLRKYISKLETQIVEKQSCDDWHDVPSDEMTLKQARQAVKDLRKKLAEYLEQEPKIVALLEKTYADICNCVGGEGWFKIDGKEYYTDVGYAIEGMSIFVEVLKQRLAKNEDKE